MKVTVGDRVQWHTQHGMVERVIGGYHAVVYFGKDRTQEFRRNVEVDDLIPGLPFVTNEEIAKRDPSLAERVG